MSEKIKMKFQVLVRNSLKVQTCYFFFFALALQDSSLLFLEKFGWVVFPSFLYFLCSQTYQRVIIYLFQVGYRHYCETRFSKLIGKPSIFDEENEEYAYMRCKEIWVKRYPTQSFENEENSSFRDVITVENQELLEEVKRQRHLYSKFSEPFRSEIVYLVAARQRYRGFLYMLQRFSDECSSFVAASDIFLMWLTHQVDALSFSIS